MGLVGLCVRDPIANLHWQGSFWSTATLEAGWLFQSSDIEARLKGWLIWARQMTSNGGSPRSGLELDSNWTRDSSIPRLPDNKTSCKKSQKSAPGTGESVNKSLNPKGMMSMAFIFGIWGLGQGLHGVKCTDKLGETTSKILIRDSWRFFGLILWGTIVRSHGDYWPAHFIVLIPELKADWRRDVLPYRVPGTAQYRAQACDRGRSRGNAWYVPPPGAAIGTASMQDHTIDHRLYRCSKYHHIGYKQSDIVYKLAPKFLKYTFLRCGSHR